MAFIFGGVFSCLLLTALYDAIVLKKIIKDKDYRLYASCLFSWFTSSLLYALGNADGESINWLSGFGVYLISQSFVFIIFVVYRKVKK